MSKVHYRKLFSIADRIDAAHKRAIGHVDDRDTETMEENGWVKLPVDANGEIIRVGDDMETLSVWHEGMHSRVEWISLTADGWEVDGELPTSMRHYRKPTIEDVLREMHEKLDEVTALYVGEAIDSNERDRDEARIFAEYAERLAMKDDEE